MVCEYVCGDDAVAYGYDHADYIGCRELVFQGALIGAKLGRDALGLIDAL